MTRRNVFGHNRASTNDGSFADGDSFQYDCLRTDKSTRTDFDGPGVSLKVIAPIPSAHWEMKVVVEQHGASSDDGLFTDFDAVAGAKNRPTEAHSIGEDQPGAGRQC